MEFQAKKFDKKVPDLFSESKYIFEKDFLELCCVILTLSVNEFYSTKFSKIVLNWVHKKMTITFNFEPKLQSLFFEKIYGGNLTTLTQQMASLLEHRQADWNE